MHHLHDAAGPALRANGKADPAALEALVLACLAKDPDERPASAEWLAARLAECETSGDWTPARAHEWWDTIRGGAAPTPQSPDQTRTSITPPGVLGKLGATLRKST